MSRDTEVERTEVANSALDFLLARLQSEIGELEVRMETLFKDINDLKERNDG